MGRAATKVARAGRTGGIRLRIVSPLRGQAQALARPRRARAGKPLGRRDQKEFRRLLEEERDRLTEELEALEEHTPEVERQAGVDLGGSYDEDFADVAGDTFEREKGFAIGASVRGLLTQVEEALARIDEGTYGTCENCGRAIHPARLKAIPYAKLCIECKAREERANGLGR
ncbi:MAG: TraR/DksA family transcriptional regulator [Anaerolineales bacterium]